MRRFVKRIVSVVLVIAILGAFLPAMTGMNSYFAAESDGESSLQGSNTRIGNQSSVLISEELNLVRGVVNEKDDVPWLFDQGAFSWIQNTGGNQLAALGTPQNPFLVLEIVPYAEYAEFGYLIGGCEPVNIYAIPDPSGGSTVTDGDSAGSGDSWVNLKEILENYLGTATVENSFTKVCYFEDEPEYARLYNRFNNYIQTSGQVIVYGYYEKVDPGSGHFTFANIETVKEEAEKVSLAPDSSDEDIANTGGGEPNADVVDSNVTNENLNSDNSVSSDGDVDLSVVDDGSNADDGDWNADGGDSNADEDWNADGGNLNANAGDMNASDGNMSADESDPNVGDGSLNADEGEFYEEDSLQVSDALTMLAETNIDNIEHDADDEKLNDAVSGVSDAVTNVQSDSDSSDGTTNVYDGEFNENTSDSTNDASIVQTGTVSDGDKIGAGAPIDADENLPLQAAADEVSTFKLDLTYDKAGGLWEWHTVTLELNDFGDSLGGQNAEWYDFENLTSDEVLEIYELYSSGQRIYASRTTGKDAQGFLFMDYRAYENKELFLIHSLGLTKEAAENYSIVVKTVTTDELNAEGGVDWINRANLIYLSSTGHHTEEGMSEDDMSDDQKKYADLVKLWEEYGWFHETVKSTTDSRVKNQYEQKDLEWSTAFALYQKVTGMKGEADFAGLIIDESIYNLDSSKGFYTSINTDGTVNNNISINVYDWNLEKTMDSSDGGKAETISNITGSNNNIYKLAIMLQAMDPYLFRSIYLTEDLNGNGVPGTAIQGDTVGDAVKGINNWQNDADAQDYWSVESFLLRNPYVNMVDYKDMINKTDGVDADYENRDYWWNNYHSILDPTNARYQYRANGHVFIRSDNTGIVKDYSNDVSEAGDITHSGLTNVMREILAKPDVQANDITVLDLEPFGESKSLTQSYVRMLLPFCRGNISIDHQTTAEFIGRSEDLIGGYQMIYLGVDFSGLNTGEANANVIGAYINEDTGLPAWKNGDNVVGSMDGLIYSHTGGMETIDEAVVGPISVNSGQQYYEKRSAYFYRNNYLVETKELRYSGNDISYRKLKELEIFLAANRPVVAECYLYDLGNTNIDKDSYIYQLVSESKSNTTAKMLFDTKAAGKISEAVLNIPQNVVFTGCPKDYSLTDEYLDFRGGRTYLDFTYAVNGNINDYMYKIYIDRDGDSVFEDNSVGYPELVDTGVLPQNGISYLIPSNTVGVVHWKIMIYSNGDLAEQYVKTGFSAVRSRTEDGDAKEKIKVLQILPDYDDPKAGTILNLQDELNYNSSFKDYWDKIRKEFGYSIEVVSVEKKDFEKYFVNKFEYSYIDDGGKIITEFSGLSDLSGNLMDYNMIIVGSGVKDISNVNGALDFLWYWADLGRSIIFLPDLTSMGYQESFNNNAFWNFESWDARNNWLRDLVGMDRYQSYGRYLVNNDNQANGREVKTLNNYWKMLESQNGSDVSFDWLKETAYEAGDPSKGATYAMTQGFNYFTVLQLKDGKGYISEELKTETVTQVNKGQVSFYPFKIEEINGQVKVSATHAQYFQLNPEDKDVTVWYCLAGEDNIYGQSPNDAMNNYYIYSKGNIFYSGIELSEGSTDSEMRLFINTMVAAYDVSVKLPVVVINNMDAEPGNSRKYEITLMQNFDTWNSDYDVYAGGKFDGRNIWESDGFVGGNDYSIDFSAMLFDNDDQNSTYNCTIVFYNITADSREEDFHGHEAYNYSVSTDNNEVIYNRRPLDFYPSPGSDPEYFTINKDKTYTLKFSKNINEKSEAGSHLMIRFYVWNDNDTTIAEITDVHIYMQPLFLLD